MENTFIYLDHAAATPVSEKVLAVMLPYFSENFFNPSAPYLPSLKVRRDYEEAKNQIAQIIGAKGDEIVITAGATESINLAFTAVGRAVLPEILVADFEHYSVLAASEKFGNPNKIKITKKGIIDLEDLKNKITEKTELVSVMLANNETGVIQPIPKIAQIIAEERSRRLNKNILTPIYLHSDASQGVGQLDIHVSRLGVDMLTLNAGKIYGPKQVGLLWSNKEVKLKPQIVGGGQEQNLRSGTENVPGVIGFARALKIADKHRKSENARLIELKHLFKKILISNFTDEELIFLAEEKKQLNSHISISFPGIDAERLVFSLEYRGILVATGSACAASKGTRSNTLVAMDFSEREIDGSLRVSLGKLSTFNNTKIAAEIISEVARDEMQRIRKITK